MIYYLYAFDGLELPLNVGGGSLSLDSSPGVDYIALPGFRTYDALRTTQAYPARLAYDLDCLLVGTSPADLKTKYDALRAKDGVLGTLIRRDMAGVDHQITARMTIPNASYTPQTGVRAQRLNLRFDSTQPYWLGTARTGSALVYETQTNLYIINNGNASCLSPVFTVIAGAESPISAIHIWCGPDSLGRKWSMLWTGNLGAGWGLFIDCGAMTVKKSDGSNAYSGFSLTSDHNQSNWFEVLAGGVTAACVATRIIDHFGGTWSYTLNDAWKG